MIVFVLTFVLVLAVQAQSGSTDSMQEGAQHPYERQKHAAIRINELGQQIHSEDDASALVSEVAAVFEKELPPAWAIAGIRERVAHAEYESIRNPAKLISEQRIVEVWNQYIREIEAPEEALVTVGEIHNLRDGDFTAAQLMWAQGNQTIWTVPNVYALSADGELAEGCRAIEAIRVIYELYRFGNLTEARDRVRRGIVPSEEVKKRLADPTQQPQRPVHRLEVRAYTNPVHAAERRYIQEHGLEVYNQWLKHLFDKLFPVE